MLRLEDLMLALRTTENARNGGISVSIDPTEEGRLAARPRHRHRIRQYTPAVAEVFEKALGPQKISINGVPKTSHFARMLVASDYKMKRIAMKLEAVAREGAGQLCGHAQGRCPKT